MPAWIEGYWLKNGTESLYYLSGKALDFVPIQVQIIAGQ
jgi:hypothetical protein